MSGNPYNPRPPYAAPVAPAQTRQSKIFGWLMALFAVIAIAFCFGPWASLTATSTPLSDLTTLTKVDVTMSVNAFNETACSGMQTACDELQNNSGGNDDDGGSLWEGWVILVVGAVVIALGVLRGLGSRAASLLAGLGGAGGGLVVVGLAIYRWSWIHDRTADLEDAMRAAGPSDRFNFDFGAGWGLWLTLVAGLLLLLAGAGGLVKRQ